MDKKWIDSVIGILLVPLALALFLVPFSLLIGWNLITVILFWFVIVPVLSYLTPLLLTRANHQLTKSLVGLLVFYAILVFMIYLHYKTDFFLIMIFSFVINLITVFIVSHVKRLKLINQQSTAE